MTRWLVRAAAAVALAAVLLVGWGYAHRRGPVLWQVAPQPGATLRLRQVPIEAQLSTALGGLATLSVDGRAVLTGLPAPYISYLPPTPLPPGSHRLRVDVLLPGRAFSYRWQVRIAKGAQARVGPYDADTYQALFAVNRIRAAAGLSPWRLSLPLEGASRAHSDYFLHNLRRYGTLTDSVHSELPGWPYYAGRTPWARDVAFGYNGDGDSEVMAFGVDTQEAVELWLDSVYHRFGLLDPGLTSMGFGIAGKASQSDDLPVTTLNAGFESRAEVPDGQSVVWPAQGQTGVPLSFEEGEIPDPLANFKGARYPAGYPVTLSFFGLGVKGLEVHAASLSVGSHKVAYHLLTPQVERNPGELGMSVALLPSRPLQPNSPYKASIAGRYRDSSGWHPFRVTTSFTTASA